MLMQHNARDEMKRYEEARAERRREEDYFWKLMDEAGPNGLSEEQYAAWDAHSQAEEAKLEAEAEADEEKADRALLEGEDDEDEEDAAEAA